MNTVFEISGFAVTEIMLGGAVALLVLLLAALIYTRIHRSNAWNAYRTESGFGRFLNSIGFGLLPALAVMTFSLRNTFWGVGRASASGWLKNTLFTVTDEAGKTLYAIWRFEIIGILLLFALLVLWLALRRRPLADRGDILAIALAGLGAMYMLTDTLHGPEFLTFFGVRFGQVAGAALMLLALMGWTIRNIRRESGAGITIVCWLLFVLALGLVGVREYTDLLGTERMTLSVIQLIGTLMALTAVLCLGRASRERPSEDRE